MAELRAREIAAAAERRQRMERGEARTRRRVRGKRADARFIAKQMRELYRQAGIKNPRRFIRVRGAKIRTPDGLVTLKDAPAALERLRLGVKRLWQNEARLAEAAQAAPISPDDPRNPEFRGR
jgi:hypothetical protein